MYEDYTISSSHGRDKYINEYRTNKRMINCSERIRCIKQESTDILDESDRRTCAMLNMRSMSRYNRPINLNSNTPIDMYSNSSLPGGLL